MDPEDLPKPKANMVIGENLETASIVELEQRIHALEAEIIRVNAEMKKKQASKQAADAFFKS